MSMLLRRHYVVRDAKEGPIPEPEPKPEPIPEPEPTKKTKKSVDQV